MAIKQKQIHYQRTTAFLGRNGRFKQTGLLVSQFDGQIDLVPITSKGLIGRAMLSLPNTELHELITILQTMLKP